MSNMKLGLDHWTTGPLIPLTGDALLQNLYLLGFTCKRFSSLWGDSATHALKRKHLRFDCKMWRARFFHAQTARIHLSHSQAHAKRSNGTTEVVAFDHFMWAWLQIANLTCCGSRHVLRLCSHEKWPSCPLNQDSPNTRA
jgi:hypothetical protein